MQSMLCKPYVRRTCGQIERSMFAGLSGDRLFSRMVSSGHHAERAACLVSHGRTATRRLGTESQVHGGGTHEKFSALHHRLWDQLRTGERFYADAEDTAWPPSRSDLKNVRREPR